MFINQSGGVCTLSWGCWWVTTSLITYDNIFTTLLQAKHTYAGCDLSASVVATVVDTTTSSLSESMVANAVVY